MERKGSMPAAQAAEELRILSGEALANNAVDKRESAHVGHPDWRPSWASLGRQGVIVDMHKPVRRSSIGPSENHD